MIYQRRWKEECDKFFKKNVSIGKSATKILSILANHFLAVVLAYLKLETLELKCGLGHFRLKVQRHAVGLKAMYQHFALFRA